MHTLKKKIHFSTIVVETSHIFHEKMPRTDPKTAIS